MCVGRESFRAALFVCVARVSVRTALFVCVHCVGRVSVRTELFVCVHCVGRVSVRTQDCTFCVCRESVRQDCTIVCVGRESQYPGGRILHNCKSEPATSHTQSLSGSFSLSLSLYPLPPPLLGPVLFLYRGGGGRRRRVLQASRSPTQAAVIRGVTFHKSASAEYKNCVSQLPATIPYPNIKQADIDTLTFDILPGLLLENFIHSCTTEQ